MLMQMMRMPFQILTMDDDINDEKTSDDLEICQ
jgi:hypothetical protein